MTVAQTIGSSTSELLTAPIEVEISQPEYPSGTTYSSQGTKHAEKVLSVAGTRVLTTATARKFQERVFAALNGHDVIEVDLSETTFMDCGGLGALIALRNVTRDRNGRMRLLNPKPDVEQVLTLLEARRVFEIVTERAGC